MKKEYLFFTIIAGLIIFIGVYFFLYNRDSAQDVNIPKGKHAEKEIATKGWKVYQSKEQGFELKYPEDWRTELEGDKVFVYSSKQRGDMPEGGGSFIIEITDQSLQEFINDYESQVPLKITHQEEAEVDGILATKMTGKTAIGVDRDFIYVVNKGKNYLISYHNFDTYHLDILTSFKFLN